MDAENPLVIDLDASLLDMHSDKERAAPTFKKGFGYHPLFAFIDHGAAGAGESAAAMLRPVTPAPTPRSTTSGSWPPRWTSCRGSPEIGQGGKCWCAPTLVAAPTNS
ncbi:transposase [Nocardia sp. CA-135953]|uniref:transposase n=1 Tax=Nocardia sp. CA-135953 TaxID=3239978 RepID=UPI003D952631